MTDKSWAQDFFDADYLRLWEGSEAPEKTAREVEELWSLLKLREGSQVLDAPCGYGRISRGLAERGASVVGVDLSRELLDEAERRRGEIRSDRLRYHRHDLRDPLPESGFDVALNIFSSLGYGSEADDLAILKNLRAALRPGGRLFVETMHRDRLIGHLLSSPRPAQRLSDGTLFIEEPHFDPLAGRIATTWYWSGPGGSGQKSASIRVYSATELLKLVERAGLSVVSTHEGCSPSPFSSVPLAQSRLGVLAVREDAR
jgi:SAM-dependent methyltransferase